MTGPAGTLHPLLAARRSTRAFDDSHALTDADLARLLEAARWAPSANNLQPWRFLVARRGTPEFAALFAALAPGNKLWAGSASALILAATRTQDEVGAPLPWAVYDLGQAVAHLSIQAQADGLDVHQLGGFDPEAARTSFALPEGLTPVTVIVVGRHAPQVELPEPLATRERAQRTRLPLEDLLLEAPADLDELTSAELERSA